MIQHLKWKERIGLAIVKWLMQRGPHTRRAIHKILEEEQLEQMQQTLFRATHTTDRRDAP
jgi:hypothetical protein